jgi:cytochrome P450
MFDLNDLILTVGLIAAVRWMYYKTSRFHRLIKKLPGPPPLPIVGNAMDLMGGYDVVLETMHIDWPREYGEIYRSFIGPICNVSISSPELLEPFLASQNVIEKGADYDLLKPWLGEGLLTSSGPKWRSRRRLLTPAFHFKILENFVPIFDDQSLVLCRQIEKRMREVPNDENKVVIDVFPLLIRCTLDVICEAAMDTRLNSQTKDSDYLNSALRLTRIFVERLRKPWLNISNLTFSWTKLGREETNLVNYVHGFADKIILKRHQQLTEKQTEEQIEKPPQPEEGINKISLGNRRPLLDLLLDVTDDGVKLTQQEIREEIDTFMFAGHDTTASAMSWFLYCMACNPECQETVYEELHEIFGKSDRPCTFEDMAHFKYLDCCIKEALRLYPSAPLIERSLVEDIQIGEFLVPAGTNILILIYGVHHNPRIYENPNQYNPERFFPDQSDGRHPYAFIPFSAGPRNCIGQRFALMEEKVVLSSLLRRYRFGLSPQSKKPVPSYQAVLKPINGIHLVISKRQF